MQPYHVDIHAYHAYEDQELGVVGEPPSFLPRIEWVPQRLEKVIANEELHAQIYHRECIYLSRKEDDHRLETLVVLIIGDLPAIDREHVYQDYEDLGWTDNHSHESPIYRRLRQTSRRYQVVWIDISQLRVNVKSNRRHHESTRSQEVEKEPWLHPPLELVLDLKHLGDVLAVVVDVAAQALVAGQLHFYSAVQGIEGAVAFAACFVVCLILTIGTEEILINCTVDFRFLLAEVDEFEIA